MKYPYVLILFLSAFGDSLSVDNTISVNVKGSKVMGTKLQTILEKKDFGAFWDIPYAEAPLHDLRFKIQDVYKITRAFRKSNKSKRSLLVTKMYGNASVKRPRDFAMAYYVIPILLVLSNFVIVFAFYFVYRPRGKDWHNGTHDYRNPRKNTCACCYDEDCLHLSIYMPISYNQSWNLPVIVWLDHNSKLHSPDFILEEEVVVVVVTYRQFIFGFLNTGDDFAQGNMGAKDVLLSLKWVKNHISSFNGDPNRITVAGAQSAATIVSSLILTPTAEGLFSRTIIFSGSALSPADYRNYNFEIMNKLYWNLNGPFEKLNRTNLYKILANFSTGELMLASKDIFDSTEVRDGQRLINAFGPSIEVTKNAFMTKAPIDVYKACLSNNNVEVMIGFTSLEALAKLKGFIQNKKILKYLNYNFQYLLPFEGVKDQYGSKRYRKIREKIMDFYFVNGTIGERSLRRYAKYVSDQVIYPLLRQARLQGDVSCKNVYLYRFAFKGALNDGWDSSAKNLNWSGATSGDEICYLFKCKSVNDVYNSGLASNERHFIKKIARLLANFAKCGDPTPERRDDILGDLKWDPLNNSVSIRAMKMGRKLKMVDLPEQIRMNFWDQLKSEFFPDKLPKEEL